jgi:hypothetical protein
MAIITDYYQNNIEVNTGDICVLSFFSNLDHNTLYKDAIVCYAHANGIHVLRCIVNYKFIGV